MLSRFESDRRGNRRLRRLSAALAAVRLRRRAQARGLWGQVALLPAPERSPDQLRLLTLNVAHGRRIGPHQALMSRHTTQRNLMAIADLLRQLQPDVTALQEADGPSAWSGNFDHVAALARMSGLPDHFRGDHNPLAIGRFRLASGTALLSRQPLLDATSHRFALSWRDTKGFVIATVPVPAWGGLAIDLVSVHLDFLTPSARRRQIGQMVERLSGRDRPLVILGDLNCCWQYERESLEMLTDSLGLEAWRPEVSQPTYPSVRPQRRLDWILVSHHLAFADHHTVAVPLSDHLGVVADVRLRDAAAVRPAAAAGQRPVRRAAAPADGALDGLSACC